MSLENFYIELENHILLIKTILEYENEEGICIVKQSEIAERIEKNTTWISKAIKRLNAEDICIEKIKRGAYKIHYTNIEERGVFPKIIQLMKDKVNLENFTERNTLLSEKYGISKKTIQIFTGYLGFIYS